MGIMKNILLMVLFAGFVVSCNQPKVGYLKANNAEYLQDTLIVYRTVDPDRSDVEYEMYESGADWWASNSISGVMGTAPIMYSVENVKASEGGNAAPFLQEVNLIGGGVFQYPVKDIKAPNGTYLISIRIANDDHNVVLEDAFRVIIKD